MAKINLVKIKQYSEVAYLQSLLRRCSFPQVRELKKKKNKNVSRAFPLFATSKYVLVDR